MIPGQQNSPNQSPEQPPGEPPRGAQRDDQQSLAEAMQQAASAFQSGDLPRAQRLLQFVLESNPDHFDALEMSGIAAVLTGRADLAVEWFSRALVTRPNEVRVLNNLGRVLVQLKRSDEALSSYDRLVRLRPDFAEGYFNRGAILQEQKRLEEALTSYERALHVKPGYAQAHNNRGVVLHELGRLEEAVASFDGALLAKADYADADYNRGAVLQKLRRFDEAMESYERVLRISPNNSAALHNSGMVLQELRRYEQALERFERALEVKPDSAETYNCRGNVLRELRRLEQAVASYDLALQVNPGFAAAYNNRGVTLHDLGRSTQALASFERALEIMPGYAGAYNNRGTVLKDLGDVAGARDSYGRALQLNPCFDWLFGTWLHTKMRLCDWSDFASLVAQLTADIRDGKRVTPPFPVITLIDALLLQRQATQIWANENCPASDLPPPIQRCGRREKVRVGYYSADFHHHATANLIADLFETHDRDRFELIAFSYGPDVQDEMRKRLSAAFDRFLDVRSRSDREVAQISREMQIDIAVDLKGFTQDGRAGIFSHRVAPIQVNYLGYPGTMTTSYVDYLIADHTVAPLEAAAGYSEKIVYLPGSYQVNDRKRRIAEVVFTRGELGLPPTGFVYCCFNNNYKITPATFDGWMRILKRVKDSVLWLLEDNVTAARNLRREAEVRGMAATRLIFGRRMPSDAHLSRHRLADLFLDTAPCNAHTTASDALWAGLPVLTRIGESFAGRVAASLLNAVELPELIATTQDQYEKTAIALAEDPDRLAELKAKLNSRRLTVPLFDTEQYTRQLEAAYLQMYDRYQAGLSPDHIHVARISRR